MKSLQQTSLDQYQWHWQEAGKDSWTKCQRFPTNIHHELRVNDLIPDEGIGLNERKIQWVHDKDWKFKTKFPSPSGFQDFGQVELAFDGLDTIAKVALNGKTILECDNMFVPQRVDVKKHLVTSGENELDIYFDSAARVGKEREEKYGQKWQNIRESSRMYVRKNQSHWGWDWVSHYFIYSEYDTKKMKENPIQLLRNYAHKSAKNGTLVISDTALAG